jgi:hypothetical protein
MAGSLVLHRGAREVNIDAVAAVETPKPTATWFPIPHVSFLESVEETLHESGFQIASKRLALSSNNNQFFATLDLKSLVGNGVALSVGLRNSIDKTLPQGFCAGSRVFVCDNLAFRSELLVNRKHTINGEMRFHDAIANASGRLEAFRSAEGGRIEEMKKLLLDDVMAESLIFRAWEKGIVSHRQMPTVVKEWREPSHDDFGERNVWSLFNAFTEALKPIGKSNPQAFAGRTFRLNGLLLPVNEGPPDDLETSVVVESVEDLD